MNVETSAGAPPRVQARGQDAEMRTETATRADRPTRRRGEGLAVAWPPELGRRRQQGGDCGTGRPYGTRGASPSPGCAAGSDRARLDAAGLGDYLMLGKEREKPGPVGAKIPFRHARTVAPLLAPSRSEE